VVGELSPLPRGNTDRQSLLASERHGPRRIERPMSDDVIENMRARIAQCRRLAKIIHNEEAVRTLTEMANQGEIDLAKLLAERDNKSI
jgi:hypothetical protein